MIAWAKLGLGAAGALVAGVAWMLAALSRRAERRGIENLEPAQGDASALPARFSA